MDERLGNHEVALTKDLVEKVRGPGKRLITFRLHNLIVMNEKLCNAK